MSLKPAQIARNILLLLQEDPKRYRNFGVWWWPIKAIMKHYYTREQLHLLGDYEDPAGIEKTPAASLDETLLAALETYAHNARYNLGRAETEGPDGETYVVYDEDAGV